MDAAARALFLVVKAQRRVIRDCVLLEGMTVDWLIPRARDAVRTVASGRSPAIGPPAADAGYADYCERLRSLVDSLEAGSAQLTRAWIEAVKSRDYGDFLDRRTSLVRLIDRLQVGDALVGKFVRVDRRAFVERAAALRSHVLAGAGDVTDFERDCRMTIDQFLINCGRIDAARSVRDAARRQIVPHYERWARMVAERLHPGSEKAVAESRVGLMRATAYFDCEAGYEFETYASWWLKKAMTDGFPPLPPVT
jgi:hypothetical protein